MSIRTIVNRLEYSQYVFISAMLCIGLPLSMKDHNIFFYALEIPLVIVTISGVLFHLFYAPWALQRSEDPGLLYSVLETFNKTTLWFAKRYKPDESYKPSFSTSQFLADNNLSADIPYGKPATYLYAFLIISNLAVMWFLYYRTHQVWVILVLSGFLVVQLLQLTKSNRRAADPTPVISFTEQGLRIAEDNFPWKDIYEWQYNAGGKNERSKFIISYTNAETGIADTVVELPGLNTNKVDFLLLLIYFKAKYGQQSQ